MLIKQFLFLLFVHALLLSSPGHAKEGHSIIFRGHLVLGHEVRSFKPCGKDIEYWVLDHTSGELWKVYRELTHKPYQPMYAEVRGQLGASPSHGFGADYEQQLTVAELRRAGVETHGCGEDLEGIEFLASGNEPFWNVQISESGIIFSELGKPKFMFPYAPPSSASGGWQAYSSRIDEPVQHEIEIALREKRCIDSMSGEHFNFAAQVSLDGRMYTGCAREGWRNISQADTAPPKPLSMEALKNAEYQTEFSKSGRAKLTEGLYKEKIAPKSATELVIVLSDKVAFGDLNGDGIDDAAVVLVTDPGGSGTFYDLAAVLNQNGTAKHIASAQLGDRIRIRTLSIQSAKIIVDMIAHGSKDPMCCPTSKVTQKYVVQRDKLVQLPESTPMSSDPEINGAKALLNKQWVLQSFGIIGSEESLIPNTAISLEFAPDNRLHGSGGCNRYFGGYDVGTGNSLSVGHMGSTRMACPEAIMDQEMRYFRALQKTSTFSVDEHQLKVFYDNGQGVLNFVEKPNPK